VCDFGRERVLPVFINTSLTICPTRFFSFSIPSDRTFRLLDLTREAFTMTPLYTLDVKSGFDVVDVTPGAIPIYNSSFVITFKRGSASATRCKLGDYSALLATAKPDVITSDVTDPLRTISPRDEVNRMVCQLFTNNLGNFELEIEWEGSGQYQKLGIFMTVFERPEVTHILPELVYQQSWFHEWASDVWRLQLKGNFPYWENFDNTRCGIGELYVPGRIVSQYVAECDLPLKAMELGNYEVYLYANGIHSSNRAPELVNNETNEYR
jgi:hypothetical protein